MNVLYSDVIYRESISLRTSATIILKGQSGAWKLLMFYFQTVWLLSLSLGESGAPFIRENTLLLSHTTVKHGQK